jgi:DNA-binding NarL/FixJ family response regulator
VIKTLIVDDSATFRGPLCDMLRGRFPGMAVAEAETIDEAWTHIDALRPGLVFVDIKLRAENGLDLAARIRRSYPDILIAVITSSDIPEYRAAAYDCGAHYFIPKGFATSADIVQLVDAIQTRRPPQWALGADYINPAMQRWKKPPR